MYFSETVHDDHTSIIRQIAIQSNSASKHWMKITSNITWRFQWNAPQLHAILILIKVRYSIKYLFGNVLMSYGCSLYPIFRSVLAIPIKFRLKMVKPQFRSIEGSLLRYFDNSRISSFMHRVKTKLNIRQMMRANHNCIMKSLFVTIITAADCFCTWCAMLLFR